MQRSNAIVLALAACVILATIGIANGQVFYSYPGAPPVKDLEPAIGVAVGLGDDIFRIVGYSRFNLSSISDLGLEIVLDNLDDNWRAGLAADVRYAIVPKHSTLPFDLSLNGGMGIEGGGDITNFNVPLGAVLSRPLELNNGRVLVPFGGAYLLIVRTSIDTPPGKRDFSDTEVDVELRGGANLIINDATGMYAALHIGAGTMFFIGLNVGL